MGMQMQIEVGEIHDRFVGTSGRDLTHAHEPSETLDDFNRRNSNSADASTTITPPFLMNTVIEDVSSPVTVILNSKPKP
jgi:hypothetical protein